MTTVASQTTVDDTAGGTVLHTGDAGVSGTKLVIQNIDATDTVALGPPGVTFANGFVLGTEATIHDTLQMKDHLAVVSKAGLIALWLGVEDMTGTLIKKGQSVDKTTEAFHLLQKCGINPMPMMMHHDTQPLYTPGKPYGLINQAKMLRKAGAITLCAHRCDRGLAMGAGVAHRSAPCGAGTILTIMSARSVTVCSSASRNHRLAISRAASSPSCPTVVLNA